MYAVVPFSPIKEEMRRGRGKRERERERERERWHGGTGLTRAGIYVWHLGVPQVKVRVCRYLATCTCASLCYYVSGSRGHVGAGLCASVSVFHNTSSNLLAERTHKHCTLSDKHARTNAHKCTHPLSNAHYYVARMHTQAHSRVVVVTHTHTHTHTLGERVRERFIPANFYLDRTLTRVNTISLSTEEHGHSGLHVVRPYHVAYMRVIQHS